MPGREVTDEDRAAAGGQGVALGGIAVGDDAHDLVRALAPLHRKRDTFPAEVLFDVGADALDIAGVTRDQPLEYTELFERFLPECSFRGRSQNERRHYALRATVMIHAGVNPDLLDDTYWWGDIEDLWTYALFAIIICVRAASDRRGEPVAEVAARIAARRGVSITAAT